MLEKQSVDSLLKLADLRLQLGYVAALSLAGTGRVRVDDPGEQGVDLARRRAAGCRRPPVCSG
jgi:hypothetical protein